MRFIRTITSILEVVEETELVYRVKAVGQPHHVYAKSKCNTEVLEEADNIESLCDRIIIIDSDDYLKDFKIDTDEEKRLVSNVIDLWSAKEVYGAIWTKGYNKEPVLKSVSKLNKESKRLELL